MTDSKTFLMRRNALEGFVFYYNKLADGDYKYKYFPKTKNQPNYDNAPKIAVPITSIFINKIANLLHAGMTIEFSNAAQQAVWDAYAAENNWNEFSRNVLVKTLICGNVLTTLTQDKVNNIPILNTWDGQFVFEDETSIGYEYVLNTRTNMSYPYISHKDRFNNDEKLITVPINEIMYGDEIHMLGFTPAVLFKAIDRDEDDVYGVPYYMRFRDLNIEYNHIISQISKAIKILQNVIVTNTDPTPDEPELRIDPDTVLRTGRDGKVEQLIRNLNTEPEHTYAKELLDLIHNAAQIPSFLSGLGGSPVTNLESGVALEILSSPVKELMSRLRLNYKDSLNELVEKIMFLLYAFNGVTPPTLDFQITLNQNVVPTDKTRELDNLIKLVNAGILTPEAVRNVAEDLIK